MQAALRRRRGSAGRCIDRLLATTLRGSGAIVERCAAKLAIAIKIKNVRDGLAERDGLLRTNNAGSNETSLLSREKFDRMVASASAATSFSQKLLSSWRCSRLMTTMAAGCIAAFITAPHVMPASLRVIEDDKTLLDARQCGNRLGLKPPPRQHCFRRSLGSPPSIASQSKPRTRLCRRVVDD